jgi:hypothetical protein
MDDVEILHRIHDLVAQEKELREQAQDHRIDQAAEQDGLARLEETLDQCWDLLRQRRARREFGEDPADAQVRDTGTVEHYLQ